MSRLKGISSFPSLQHWLSECLNGELDRQDILTLLPDSAMNTTKTSHISKFVISISYSVASSPVSSVF